MTFEGVLTKMQTELGSPINYYMVFDSGFMHVNQLLNKEITLALTGYQCLNCKSPKKIFRQGFCYDCFSSSPAVGDWIMKPELSTAHLGIADRDLDYESRVQLQPHLVYFAVSSEIKVGVTRGTQMPTRWIDQGAEMALPIVEVPNRYLAGITEVALKNHYADKTNWRKMLTNDIISVDLFAERNKIKDLLPAEVQPYFDTTIPELCALDYPVLQYPKSINSLSLEKNPIFTGVLMGIKGQYLLFADGTVFNVRSAEGQKVTLTLN